jgi:hypothetical protein
MLEAQWTHDKYQPSFEEHEELSSLSTTLPMLFLVGLMGYGCDVTTKELLEWTSALPDVVRAASKIGRFLNDVSSYKVHKPPQTHICTRSSVEYILPPFQNIRCFTFVKEMYLDIF